MNFRIPHCPCSSFRPESPLLLGRGEDTGEESPIFLCNLGISHLQTSPAAAIPVLNRISKSFWLFRIPSGFAFRVPRSAFLKFRLPQSSNSTIEIRNLKFLRVFRISVVHSAWLELLCPPLLLIQLTLSKIVKKSCPLNHMRLFQKTAVSSLKQSHPVSKVSPRSQMNKHPKSPYSETSCISYLRGALRPRYQNETISKNSPLKSQTVSSSLKSLISRPVRGLLPSNTQNYP